MSDIEKQDLVTLWNGLHNVNTVDGSEQKIDHPVAD